MLHECKTGMLDIMLHKCKTEMGNPISIICVTEKGILTEKGIISPFQKS